jgi:hypothetical protein
MVETRQPERTWPQLDSFLVPARETDVLGLIEPSIVASARPSTGGSKTEAGGGETSLEIVVRLKDGEGREAGSMPLEEESAEEKEGREALVWTKADEERREDDRAEDSGWSKDSPSLSWTDPEVRISSG